MASLAEARTRSRACRVLGLGPRKYTFNQPAFKPLGQVSDAAKAEAEKTVDWTSRHIDGIGDLGGDTMARAVDDGGDAVIAEVVYTADTYKKAGMPDLGEQLLKDTYANVKNPDQKARLKEAGNAWYAGDDVFGGQLEKQRYDFSNGQKEASYSNADGNMRSTSDTPENAASGKASGSANSINYAQTDEDVDISTMYSELGFDPEADGQWEFAMTSPIDAIMAKQTANKANEQTASIYANQTGNGHNNEADAFRHAYWSYLMTQDIGVKAAQSVGDGHEITTVNPDGERLMDLYNNKVGRELALDPANQGRDPVTVIQEAIKSGKLRVKPFNLPHSTHQLTYP